MYYKQPRYLTNFQCIGGECPESCCFGWRIYWTKDEIDKILNAENISPELKKLTEESFIEDPDKEGRFDARLKAGKQCAFHDSDGLCMIQKELGAEYLSNTCTTYPRHLIMTNEIGYCFCRMTCPEIMKMLYNDEKCMEMFSSDRKNSQYSIFSKINTPKDLKTRPEQRYRREILEFFYELISDKSLEVERAIMLGSIAADELAKTIAREDYDYIPQQLKTLRKQLRERSSLDVVNAVEPNHGVKLRVLLMLCEEFIGRTAAEFLHDSDGNIFIEMYKRGHERLNETLKDHQYFLRNLALQLLFELDVPFKFADKSIFENYGLYAAVFACFKFNMECALSIDEPIKMKVENSIMSFDSIEEKIIGFSSIMSRGICQNDNSAKEMIEELNAQNFMDHGHLAAFIL